MLDLNDPFGSRSESYRVEILIARFYYGNLPIRTFIARRFDEFFIVHTWAQRTLQLFIGAFSEPNSVNNGKTSVVGCCGEGDPRTVVFPSRSRMGVRGRRLCLRTVCRRRIHHEIYLIRDRGLRRLLGLLEPFRPRDLRKTEWEVSRKTQKDFELFDCFTGRPYLKKNNFCEVVRRKVSYIHLRYFNELLEFVKENKIYMV